MPADRVKSLLTHGHDLMYAHPYREESGSTGDSGMMAGGHMRCHYYGTGTVGNLQGIVGSLGGNTVDLVIGKDTSTQCLTKDSEGNFLFRVWERFAVRLKDPSAFMRLEFGDGSGSTDLPTPSTSELTSSAAFDE